MNVVGTESPLDAMQTLTGFGQGATSMARVAHVATQDSLQQLVNSAEQRGTDVLARGLGRAYGDAAQCAGGTVIDCTGIDRILEADFTTGTVRLEAGCSLGALLRTAVPKGWFIPVTPGTRHVTVGGAIAADVHGKNHHRDGSFGSHVQHLKLITARGVAEISPSIDSALFWATVGGMGLTGVIAEATLRLHRIETSLMRVDTERAMDLEQCMDRLAVIDQQCRYSVAWVDGLARGRHLGRAVINSAEHAQLSDLSAKARTRPLAYNPRERLAIPVAPPANLLGRTTIKAFNELWHSKSPVRRSGELQSIASFFHPLDAIRHWNRLYGQRGFTQYQFVVPHDKADVLRKALELFHNARVVPSLVVLKSFGAGNLAPLSFPMAGWTLATDLALGTPALARALDELDELVASAGGRVYLAKDGRLRPELFGTMYPRLDEWRAVCHRVDPRSIFTSDLWRRLSAGERGDEV